MFPPETERNDMNYSKIYWQLIAKRKENVIHPSSNVLYEQHHIIPRCMLGSDEPDNLINLTIREHFIAHLLLWKIQPNSSLSLAVHFMANTRTGLRLTSRQFEKLKIEVRKVLSESSKQQWENKTPEQKAQTIQAMIDGMHKWRAILSEEEKRKQHELCSKRSKLAWQNYPEDLKLKKAKQHSQTLLNKSPSEKLERAKKCKATWQNKSLEELEALKVQISKSTKQMWNDMPEEKRQQHAENTKIGLHKWLDNRTNEEKQLMRERSRQGRKTLKERLGKDKYQEFCASLGKNLQKHCKEWRENMTIEERNALKQKQRESFAERRQTDEFAITCQKLSVKTKESWNNATPEQKAARGKAISNAKKSIVFTEEQYDIIRKYSLRKAAQMIGCTIKVIQRGRRELGIVKHKSKNETQQQLNKSC